MVVLGLGYTNHEASVALVADGIPRTAIAIERITRLKKDGMLVGRCTSDLSPGIEYCLEHHGFKPRDVDLIVWSHVDHPPPDTISRLLAPHAGLDFTTTPKLSLPHHFAHACTAFYLSPFADAAVLVADGWGGPLDGTVSNCEGPEPQSLKYGRPLLQNLLNSYTDTAAEDPGSARELESFYAFDGLEWSLLRKVLGYFGGIGGRYQSVAETIFGSEFDAGKLMGLAPFGDPAALSAAGAPGDWRFLETFETGSGEGITPAFRAVRGQVWNAAKQRIKLWRTGSTLRGRKPDYEHPIPAGFAALMQRESEDALVALAQWLRNRTASENLCLSGGVALNCVANSRVAREAGFKSVFVPPAPGDDGIGIGCALFGAALHGELRREPFAKSGPVFLGRPYPRSDDEIRSAGLVSVDPVPDIATWAAARIAEGSVIAWYQGGAELGPRALGHRSFLADPRDPNMRDHLNAVVKNREMFRPFAPVILEEAVADYFEELHPSYFMSFVATVRPEKRHLVPAITHVDGTSRYQLLREQDNPELHAVVTAFAALTGVPMLLNTSFNRAGEPIVETPAQAAACASASSADFLVVDGQAWLIGRMGY